MFNCRDKFDNVDQEIWHSPQKADWRASLARTAEGGCPHGPVVAKAGALCNFSRFLHIHSGSVRYSSQRWMVYEMTKLSVLLLAIVFASLFVSASDTPRGDAPAPVLVELFTSEGCSSCPPADALLQQLDRTQPVGGAQLIVLSEHVDYWNHIGWTDPYSSRFFSDRQNAYSERFGLSSVYTPEMVVDGTTEFVGGDSRLASQAVEKALALPKVAIKISSISLDASKTLQAHIDTGALPETSKIRKADVFLVTALNHAESQVLRGENGGRRLTHVGVVQTLTKVGSLEVGKSFSQDVHVKLDSRTDAANLRVIAFIQQSGQKQVLGVAQQRAQ